jgi:hypothetical protein
MLPYDWSLFVDAVLPVAGTVPQAFEWIPVVNSIILFSIIAGALIKYSSWRATEEKRKVDAAKEQKAMVVTVCEEFTNGLAYRASRDQRTREIAATTVDQAFRDRASTFVDAKVYEAETRAFRDDIARLSDDIKENSRTLAKISGQLSVTITRDPHK